MKDCSEEPFQIKVERQHYIFFSFCNNSHKYLCFRIKIFVYFHVTCRGIFKINNSINKTVHALKKRTSLV